MFDRTLLEWYCAPCMQNSADSSAKSTPPLADRYDDLDRKQSGPEALATTIASGSSIPPPMPEQGDPWVGRRVDHFLIEERLGNGGMGAVYRARDLSLDREVAIKVLRRELVNSPKLRERFLQEARAQARVNHPHIVHIYYIGQTSEDDDQQADLFFAMELVRGETLEAVLKDTGRLSAEQGRLDMLQVARGLRAARAEGFVHRDIKPSNLMRDPDGNVKVADFGLVMPVHGRQAGGPDESLVGSPLYMSPEQVEGRDLDHRSDMYSLGCCFYHLIAGVPPYAAEAPLDVMDKHRSEPVQSVQDDRGDVPPAMASILSRLMQKNPDDRYPDYNALIEALQAASPSQRKLASFWPRAAALLIDTWFAAALIALIGWPGLVLHLAHLVVGHARFGQTLGKRLLHIQVTSLDGEIIGIRRSAVRTLAALWLPFLVGGTTILAQGAPVLIDTIERLNPTEFHEVQNLVVAVAIGNGFMTLVYLGGLATALFHRDKRAAHDLLVGTVVRYHLEAA